MKALTNEIYQASRPPAVRELFKLKTGQPRRDLAASLMHDYVIDPAIDMDGGDAFDTMQARIDNHFSWVPSLGQAEIDPGKPTVPPTPERSITVSVNADDPQYKPNTDPAPVKLKIVGNYDPGATTYPVGDDATVNGNPRFRNSEMAFVDSNGMQVPEGTKNSHRVEFVIEGLGKYHWKPADPLAN